MHASTLNGLMLILKVAEQGSINKAAAALNLSQPSLTRALRQLEARIGGEVFVRTARGVVLTPFGSTLVEHARTIQQESQKVQQAINVFQKTQSRFLAVGVVRVHPLLPFCRALFDFRRSEPAARLHFTYGRPEEVMALLRAGQVEFILTSLLDGEAAQGLHQDPMFLDDVGIYCRPENPLARRTRIGIRDLQNATWILGPPGFPTRESMHHLFAAHDASFPEIAIEADDTQLRRTVVQQSDFVSAFQLHHVQSEVEAGSLVRLGHDWQQEQRAIGAISLGPRSRLARTFLDLLRRRYHEARLPPVPRQTGGAERLPGRVETV